MNKENFSKQLANPITRSFSSMKLPGLALAIAALGAFSIPVGIIYIDSTSNAAFAESSSKAPAKSKPDSKPHAQDKSDKKDDGDKSDKSDKSDKKDGKSSDKADKKDDKDKKEEVVNKPEPVIENVVAVSPDELVEKPHSYMGKNVKFTAAFFAFSNLALDYKPAFRSSKTHISLLVAKDKKKIPLSELKLAMLTPKEKDPDTQLLTNLKEGDTLEITGKVFSAALDDPWVEILRMKKIGGSSDDKKADASAKSKSTDAKSNDAKSDKTEKNDKSGAGKGSSDSKNGTKN